MHRKIFQKNIPKNKMLPSPACTVVILSLCVCVCSPAPHIFITKHILCHWLGAVDSLHCVFRPPSCFVINILSDYSVSGTSTGCRNERRTIGMGLYATDISRILIEVTHIISPQNISGVYHIPVKTFVCTAYVGSIYCSIAVDIVSTAPLQ